MHNLKDVPIYMKTSASGDMEASVWPVQHYYDLGLISKLLLRLE